MFLADFSFFSVLLLFFPSITIFILMHGFWCYFSNIDDVLLINPSANVFVFKDFNFCCKGCVTYSGGTDRPVELYFFISIYLT